MNSSDRLCPHAVDEVFGPFVQGCRQDFDFTLTFEQAFLSIAPSTVLILAGVWRLPLLTFRRKRLIEANTFKWLKVVWLSQSFTSIQVLIMPGYRGCFCDAPTWPRNPLGNTLLYASTENRYCSRDAFVSCQHHAVSSFSIGACKIAYPIDPYMLVPAPDSHIRCNHASHFVDLLVR